MAAQKRFENTLSEVFIPMRSSREGEERQYVGIRISELPSPDDAIWVLKEEQAHIDYWHRVAYLYYKAGHVRQFLDIAEEGYRTVASRSWGNVRDDMRPVLAILLSIGNAYARMSFWPEVEVSDQEKFLEKARSIYGVISSLDPSRDDCEAEFYASQAFVLLQRGDTFKADQFFSMILAGTGLNRKNFVPAILGKAMIAFSSKNYTLALQHFRHVLRLDPNCPANFRVGMGHCFWRLNLKEKAKLAFERAVELFPNDPNALSALATCHLYALSLESNITAMNLLSKSFSVSKSHSMTLTLLADHFYHKKEYDRAQQLADQAYSNSHSNLGVYKRSVYVVARCYEAKKAQAQGELNVRLALPRYSEALKEPHSGFLLPYYGLLSCYLYFHDIQNASDALHNLLAIDPKNICAKRMLGYLLCNSEDPIKRAEAQAYLKAVLNQNPDDIVARTSLASSEEAVDDVQAAENYSRVLKESEKQDKFVLPVIYNNFACTLFRLKRHGEAVTNFKLALEVTNEIEQVGAETDLRPYNIIINFNLARTFEASFQYDDAEKIYKKVIHDLPAYYYCFVRLAIMAREKGNLYDADAYFKDSLEYSQLHPDVWSLMGNLHLLKNELDPAYKKFWIIHSLNDEMKKDSYNLISLGNLELARLQQCLFGVAASASTPKQGNSYSSHMRKALGWYQQVLHKEPSNIWAANGIGCILACKGLLTEARGIFHQVLETKQSDVNLKEVLMNIGHTYVEEKMYHNAIQIYERCNKLSMNTDATVLQCIAKAHFLNKSYDLAQTAIIKVRRIAPHDNKVLFQLGKILRKAGWQKFQIRSGIETTNNKASHSVDGLSQMELAQKLFLTIHKSSISTRDLKFAAKVESGHCRVLILKTPRMLERMKDSIEEKQLLKSKVNQEVNALKVNQMKEKMEQEEERRRDEENRRRKRDEIKIKVEKVKQSLKLEHSHEEKKKEKKQRKEEEEANLKFATENYDSNSESQDHGKASNRRQSRKPKTPTRKVEPKSKRSSSTSADEYRGWSDQEEFIPSVASTEGELDVTSGVDDDEDMEVKPDILPLSDESGSRVICEAASNNPQEIGQVDASTNVKIERTTEVGQNEAVLFGWEDMPQLIPFYDTPIPAYDELNCEAPPLLFRYDMYDSDVGN